MSPESAPIPVLVGLGANVGDPRARLTAALEDLGGLAVAGTVRASSLWRSAPVDCPPGSPDFVNAVAALDVPADTDPRRLLAALLEAERRAGRVRTTRNAPRPLDLDLLRFGDAAIEAPGLRVPHPRAHERAFVMVPMAELVADLPWPGADATVGELARRLAPGAGLERLAS